MRVSLALAFTFLAAVAQAEDRQAECLFVTGGTAWISGPCVFSLIDQDGSFQIMTKDESIFAQVLVTEPGLGDGYWNGSEGGTHAHDGLGSLRRDNACWVNDQATICAW